jgi:FkbM family methyltransferase
LRKPRKAIKLMRHPFWIRALLHRIPATVEHAAMPFQSHYHTVVDIGANRGQFAVFAHSRLRPRRIILFEPNSDCLPQLNWVLKHIRAELHRFALGPEKAESSLFITAKNDSSSLLRPMQEQEDRDAKSHVVNQRNVAVHSLDKVKLKLGRPCLLKIDVQGYEADVLLGGALTLGQVDDVLVEVSQVPFYYGQKLFPEVDSLLRNAGFELLKFRPTWTDAEGEWEQADAFYRRRPSIGT